MINEYYELGKNLEQYIDISNESLDKLNAKIKEYGSYLKEIHDFSVDDFNYLNNYINQTSLDNYVEPHHNID
jgi:hypothetical protein